MACLSSEHIELVFVLLEHNIGTLRYCCKNNKKDVARPLFIANVLDSYCVIFVNHLLSDHYTFSSFQTCWAVLPTPLIHDHLHDAVDCASLYEIPMFVMATLVCTILRIIFSHF